MAGRVARRGGIDPFVVMEVLRAARQAAAAGADVLHLEVGQPSTGAPAAAVAAARDALDDPAALGYTDALGTASLRRRIARWYRDRHGLDLDPGRVVVTTGASAGVVLAVLSAFDPGDRVAVSRPGYPCYRQILTALGCEAVPVDVDAAGHFQPTVDQLDALHGAAPLAGVVVASPSNPTGSVLDATALAALGRWCDSAGVRLVADEIYHGITYDAPAPTALDHGGEGAIVINSFSKYFSMTGWRVGWSVMPEELVRPAELLTQNLYIAAPTLSQIAAEAAMDCTEELDAHVARYRTNRDLLRAALADAGLDTVAPPDGAFYLYADTGALGSPSPTLCQAWLEDLAVAVTPGTDFDARGGDGWVRFSFAGSTEDVAAAAKRLSGWLTRR